MNQRFDDTPFGRMVKAWPLIAGMIAFIYGVGLMAAVVKEDHDQVKEFKVCSDRLKNKDAELDIRLTRIEVAIQQLVEMKDDVRSIRRGLEKGTHALGR